MRKKWTKSYTPFLWSFYSYYSAAWLQSLKRGNGFPEAAQPPSSPTSGRAASSSRRTSHPDWSTRQSGSGRTATFISSEETTVRAPTTTRSGNTVQRSASGCGSVVRTRQTLYQIMVHLDIQLKRTIPALERSLHGVQQQTETSGFMEVLITTTTSTETFGSTTSLLTGGYGTA